MMSKFFGCGKLMIRLRRSEAGQSLVEVALSVPLLLLMMTGGAEFACLAYSAIEVSNAAKAAVQYAGQAGAYAASSATTLSSMQNAANKEVTLVPGLAAVTVSSATTTVACSDGSVPGDGNTSGPYLPSDCSSSHSVTTLTVNTTATFTPWAVVNPLLKVTNLPTSYTLNGHASQVVLQ
jgi:Flp pilus assembly protein TadG